eukprot:3184479-Prorocentrum_lima.AAC.1
MSVGTVYCFHSIYKHPDGYMIYPSSGIEEVDEETFLWAGGPPRTSTGGGLDAIVKAETWTEDAETPRMDDA